LPDGLGKLHFDNDKPIEVSNTAQRIVLPTKAQKVTLRFCHSNPTCLPDYRHHSRSLKKVLQELNIPPWQRRRIPFLYYDDVLVAAIGHFVCQEFIPNENNPSITVTWKH
ncbi:MAG: tRNA lysidine(34) synthetase TilS, partial [Colwellia sp.]|nr:tRNA lysidine(34) synthetase TilS [Colwellia sp.]